MNSVAKISTSRVRQHRVWWCLGFGVLLAAAVPAADDRVETRIVE